MVVLGGAGVVPKRFDPELIHNSADAARRLSTVCWARGVGATWKETT